MNSSDITKILESVRSGKTTVQAALGRLKYLPFEDMAYAHIDHHRGLRHGMPEVIYCEGKTVEQITGITKRMLKAGSDILATRARTPSTGRSRSLTSGRYTTRHRGDRH